MNLGEKIRSAFRDLPHRTWPVQIWRAGAAAAFAWTMWVAIDALVTGHIRAAILAAAIVNVDGSIVVSTTRFIRDRKAGRPL